MHIFCLHVVFLNFEKLGKIKFWLNVTLSDACLLCAAQHPERRSRRGYGPATLPAISGSLVGRKAWEFCTEGMSPPVTRC